MKAAPVFLKQYPIVTLSRTPAFRVLAQASDPPEILM